MPSNFGRLLYRFRHSLRRLGYHIDRLRRRFRSTIRNRLCGSLHLLCRSSRLCCLRTLRRIRRFPQVKKAPKKLDYCEVEGECMYSKDVISFAREMGYYNGTDVVCFRLSISCVYCSISACSPLTFSKSSGYCA